MSETTTLTKQISTPKAPVTQITTTTTILKELYADQQGLKYTHYASSATNQAEFDYKLKEASFSALSKDIKQIAGSDLNELLLASEVKQLIVILEDDKLDTKLALYSNLSEYENMGWTIQILYKRNVAPELYEITQKVN